MEVLGEMKMIPPEVVERITSAIREHVEREGAEQKPKGHPPSLVETLSCPYCDHESIELLSYRHFHLLVGRASREFLMTGCIVRCTHCESFMIYNFGHECAKCAIQAECWYSSFGRILFKPANFLILKEEEG